MTIVRDWTAARLKVDIEGRCRVCGSTIGVQAAHVVGRKYDGAVVDSDDVVPLCSRTHDGRGGCHQAYDAGRLELLPHLSHAEQARAALHVGLVRAIARTTVKRRDG